MHKRMYVTNTHTPSRIYMRAETGNQRICKVLLQEIGRRSKTKTDAMVNRESYALSSGLALGLVMLGVLLLLVFVPALALFGVISLHPSRSLTLNHARARVVCNAPVGVAASSCSYNDFFFEDVELIG